ncbi:RCC1 domain-containing protein [Streptomyces sp. NPDC012769]|uniref:RCC1 domain-containing protein n=1 Tax=Streptomyces sp. NPDC012769 TaxID=3364848 RepID=UPI00368D84DE
MVVRRVTPLRLLAAFTLAASALVGPAHAAAGPDPWVRSWGTNTAGQLGNGSTLRQPTPGEVFGLRRADVRSISAGGNDDNGFAVALLGDGTLRSWGSNAQGRLGNNSLTDQPFPAAVAGLSGVDAVDAGLDHVLALKEGRVYAWGGNAHGQLGIGVTGGTDGARRVPVEVPGLEGVTAIGAGCEFSVALGADGTVRTWGYNNRGQLASGDNETRNTPFPVPGLTDVTAISVGCLHVLALTDRGTVKAWGWGNEGALGNDSTANSATPVDVLHLKNVTHVSTGGWTSYARTADGTVKGWGWNGNGQIGDGTTVNRTTPVRVDALRGARDVTGGWDYTVAALDSGAVVSLGNDAQGQLGDGGAAAVVAEPVTALPAGSGVTHVTAPPRGTFAFAY